MNSPQNSKKDGSEGRFTNLTSTLNGSMWTYKGAFRPTRQDQGLLLGCKAEQSDKEDTTLKKEIEVDI